MVDKQIEQVLNELNNVRPEMLNDEAKRLFEAIMKIADDRDKALAELKKKEKEIENLKQEIEDCKKCVIREDIHNYIEELENKDKMINEMAGYLHIIQDCPNENCGANIDCEHRCSDDDDTIIECWIKYFERKLRKQ